ncbi:MAG: hypothetical protein M3R63_24960 [Actinomycetota bacterium]|nr:hypothetical protein [Actinomycetota bacterium]
MLQTQTCVSVRCDQCGDGPYSPELVAHWPTEDAALDAAAVAGWHIEDRDPSRLLCPDCGTVLRCEDRGHEFTRWRRCRCEQLVAAHRAGPDGLCGMAFRYCLRCCVHESHPTPAGVALTGRSGDTGCALRGMFTGVVIGSTTGDGKSSVVNGVRDEVRGVTR